MPYNADELECKIDNSRLQHNYGSVLRHIEKYAHVFAVGVSCGSKQHSDIKIVRAYYWTVMSEILLHKYYKNKNKDNDNDSSNNNKDYIKSFGCLKKSSELSNDYYDWKILLVRILLDQILSLHNPLNNLNSNNHNNNNSFETEESSEAASTADTISLCDHLSLADPTDHDPALILEDVLLVSY